MAFQVSADFRRIMNGETRNGWRRILFAPGFDYHFLLGASLTDPAEQVMGRFSVDTGIITEAFPNNGSRESFLLVRHSCLRPVSTRILEVDYDKSQWQMCFSCYLNPFTVATGFSQGNLNFYIIVISDVLRRNHRQFRIVAPIENPVLRPQLAYISKWPKWKLHLVFQPIKVHGKYDIIDASYDLSVGNADATIFPSSWESIQFPVGDRNYFGIDTGFERLLVFHDPFTPDNLESHFCISIDHAKSWHGATLDQWISSYRETKIGASVLKAIRAVEALPPPVYWWCTSPFELFRRIVPHPDCEILLRAGAEGVMQRWIAPPFLKRVAAQSFCKANPHVKLSEVKEATGVDVSDGVPEENDPADAD